MEMLSTFFFFLSVSTYSLFRGGTSANPLDKDGISYLEVPPMIDSLMPDDFCYVHRPYCFGCGMSDILIDETSRIVNGSVASDGEYPFQVLLLMVFSGEVRICGGSLIKSQWVLTASHCFFREGSSDLPTVRVHVGHVAVPFAIYVPLAYYILHEDFDLKSLENDIALIKLIAPLPFNDIIAPICLAEAESDIPYGRKAIVTGWGAPGSGANPTTSLMEVALDVITVEECALLTPLPPDHSKLVCTLSPFKDACQGDSGGPLIAEVCPGQWVQIGIVSFGVGCAEADHPGVFTKVSAYKEWIDENTGSDSEC